MTPEVLPGCQSASVGRAGSGGVMGGGGAAVGVAGRGGTMWRLSSSARRRLAVWRRATAEGTRSSAVDGACGPRNSRS
eukprot:3411895-Prymnesium_polylepis.1